MSYSDNNNNRPDAGYPMAPKKQKSPWFYVGMGCLGLFVLSLGTCVTIGVVATNKFKTEMGKPLDKETIKQEMAGIPEYPNATLDETATKGARTAMGMASFLMQGKKMSMAAYDTKDAPSDIIAWYEPKMLEAGYETSDANSTQLKKMGINTSRKGVVRMFIKDQEMVQVQGQQGSKEKNVLVLLRMTGFTKEEMKEFKK
jgi:hypothetical protein